MLNYFISDTLERAVKTAAQAAIAAIGASTALGQVDWKVVASTSALATLLSVLTSVASHQRNGKNGASLIDKAQP